MAKIDQSLPAEQFLAELRRRQSRGGKLASSRMTPEQRKARATHAITSRWARIKAAQSATN